MKQKKTAMRVIMFILALIMIAGAIFVYFPKF